MNTTQSDGLKVKAETYADSLATELGNLGIAASVRRFEAGGRYPDIEIGGGRFVVEFERESRSWKRHYGPGGFKPRLRIIWYDSYHERHNQVAPSDVAGFAAKLTPVIREVLAVSKAEADWNAQIDRAQEQAKALEDEFGVGRENPRVRLECKTVNFEVTLRPKDHAECRAMLILLRECGLLQP